MRHYAVPQLDNPSYYVVFCDCGRQLKKFTDEGEKLAKVEFEQWLQHARLSEQWCIDCYAKQLPCTETTTKTDKSPLTSFMDDLAATIKIVTDGFDYSKANLDGKRAAANQVSNIAATACAAIALQPIPIADFFLLTPIQIALVQAIGRIYGVPLSTKTALEIGSNIGLGLVLRQIFIVLVKMGIPMMGGLLVSTYVYTATYYMGRVAQIYFEQGRPLTEQELNQVQAARSRAESRLRELDELKAAQLINETEYQEKRSQIISEI